MFPLRVPHIDKDDDDDDDDEFRFNYVSTHEGLFVKIIHHENMPV